MGHDYTVIGKEPRTFVVKTTYDTPIGEQIGAGVWCGFVEGQPIAI